MEEQMQLTKKNYFEIIAQVDTNLLPKTIKKGHDILLKSTEHGESWVNYEKSSQIRAVIDRHFEKLTRYLLRHYRDKIKWETGKKDKHHPVVKAKQVAVPDDAHRLIRRYVLLDGKLKTRRQILLFIRAIQKAITEQKITRSHPQSQEITQMQRKLIDLHHTMPKATKVKISANDLARLQAVIGREAQMLSVRFIRAYLNLQGEQVETQKARRLYNRIANAVNRKKLSREDKYFPRVEVIMDSLKELVESGKKAGVLEIHEAELSGLYGVLDGCSIPANPKCGLNGIPAENTIISSHQLAAARFETLGFSGKWLELIGDPAPGFTAMIFGSPKVGKSSFALLFAGYLSHNFGSVLYISDEERFNKTLQEKLHKLNVEHPRLFFSDYLPGNISRYDFVFIDSVNSLRLTPGDLENLRNRYPQQSLVFIFQSTKAGHFRGNNQFMHDVDIIIEIPERGVATQSGRYSQGGAIKVSGALLLNE